MKAIIKNYFIISTGILAMSISSCKKQDFVDTNTDPGVIYAVQPEDQFLAASTTTQDDFEWYYDNYRRIMLWMQISSPATGNRPNFTNDVSNFNTRFAKVFYGRVGPRLMDVIKIIEKQSADEQAKRVYEKAIAKIFLTYYAFYVTDINGSMPYSEAFQARYGGTLTPTYDSQQQLYATFDADLKDAVQQLVTAQPVEQANYGQNDQLYLGDVSKWAKAGNALRLRLAMRLMKRDDATAKAIIGDALASPAQMESNDDSWVFINTSTSTPQNSNWDPTEFRAPKSMVDFMKDKADPRLRIFFAKNDAGEYVGAPTSPDDVSDPANAPLFSTDGLLSPLQPRLFSSNMNSGTGLNYFPFLTYADYCFMRAELGLKGITGDDAATWYNKGVSASITFYDKEATAAAVEGYTAVTQAEIDAYLAMPGVAFDAAKGLDQIASQSYFNFFKQPNEAWALWKRTGMPNSTTVFVLPQLKSNGVVNNIPRRAALDVLPSSDLNYNNQQAAYSEMAQDPGFGQGPADASGRIWWDKQ